ncbi:MAG: glycosyltransferase family 1 protein, partial [Planctomycetes bacterium]|nr:glycosyltransferase family 1 protein [Planctomycetota bacterium]
LPVVYARESALPETIGDAGLGVDADDATAFSDALARVIGDEPLRAQLIDRGNRRVAGASWLESARVLHGVWSEVGRG